MSPSGPTSEVRLTIDGREAILPRGSTVLEAAAQLGVPIPTLCYDPRLPIAGACRMCMVEEEGTKALVPACAREVRDGQRISTATDRVARARRVILELFLADHPAPCSKARLDPDGCELERHARTYGVDSARLLATAEAMGPDPSNPAIVFDATTCINCYRCVRACDDVQVNDVIGVKGRGARARIIFDLDDPMGQSTCVSCGECVQACPTGALMEKTRLAGPPESVLEVVRSVCPYCGVGCLVDYHVDRAANRIAYATGSPEGPANAGRLCVKGRFGWDYAQHRERLRVPLIRREGVPRGPLDGRRVSEVFREATWEEALDLAASRLRTIRDGHGPRGLAGLSSAKCTNEENYLFQKIIRAGLRTPNIDHCTRLCHSSSVYALQTAIGSGSMSNTVADFGDADVLFVIGSNTTENHPVIATFLKQAARRGSKLIVADPREIPLARHAAIHLRNRPGTDVALLNGLIHVILEEGLADDAFVAARTEGSEPLKEVVRPYTPELVERLAGVPRDLLVEAARTYGGSRKSAILWGMGISQHTTGSDNSFALINLALLTGNIGRPGTGLNPLRGQNNVQGASDMGAIPMYLPGYARVDDPLERARFERAWGVPLDPDVGLTVTEMFEAALDGHLKGLYIMGENPILSDANLLKVREAMLRFEFVGVQDIFLTETAEYADVVLPTASGLEKLGTYVNTDRHVQLGRPVLATPGEARQDWEILIEIGRRLGMEMPFGSPADVQAEIQRVVPAYAGISHERAGARPVQWPCPTPDHPGTAILFEESFPRGRGAFHPAEFVPARELPDAEFPYVLNTGRVLEHWHTGSMTRRAKVLDELRPRPFIEVSATDMEKEGFRDRARVRVVSRRGAIELEARASGRQTPGTVFIPFHFVEAAANLLTIDALDPHAKIPEFKFCSVRIEPVRESSGAGTAPVA